MRVVDGKSMKDDRHNLLGMPHQMIHSDSENLEVRIVVIWVEVWSDTFRSRGTVLYGNNLRSFPQGRFANANNSLFAFGHSSLRGDPFLLAPGCWFQSQLGKSAVSYALLIVWAGSSRF